MSNPITDSLNNARKELTSAYISAREAQKNNLLVGMALLMADVSTLILQQESEVAPKTPKAKKATK